MLEPPLLVLTNTPTCLCSKAKNYTIVQMIVIDTSSLIAVLLGEAVKEQLVELTKGRTLLAPQSLHWEIPNAFSAMFKRNPARLTLAEAQAALALYQTIPVRFVEIDLSRATEIAHTLNLYAYDAFMLAAAERHKAPLLSLDERCKDAARTLGIPVMEVA